MSEGYVEIMVRKETSPMMKVFSAVVGGAAGVFLLLTVMGLTLFLLPALLLAAGFYYLHLYQNVEYEYLYVDKELTIDRILGKSKRKRMETIDMAKLEVMAPLGSHELTRFQKSSRKMSDYSSGKRERNSAYVLVTSEKEFLIEPTEELVQMIRHVSPRKVFTY